MERRKDPGERQKTWLSRSIETFFQKDSIQDIKEEEEKIG